MFQQFSAWKGGEGLASTCLAYWTDNALALYRKSYDRKTSIYSRTMAASLLQSVRKVVHRTSSARSLFGRRIRCAIRVLQRKRILMTVTGEEGQKVDGRRHPRSSARFRGNNHESGEPAGVEHRLAGEVQVEQQLDGCAVSKELPRTRRRRGHFCCSFCHANTGRHLAALTGWLTGIAECAKS